MNYGAVMHTPFGALGLQDDGEALCRIDFLPAGVAPQAAGTALCGEAVRQLQAYLDAPGFCFSLPLRAVGSAFQLRVWDELCRIPSGERLSYGELAARVGSVARAVGGACGRNPLPIVIPCHRVVAAHGMGGFNRATDGTMLEIKHWLLNHERAGLF